VATTRLCARTRARLIKLFSDPLARHRGSCSSMTASTASMNPWMSALPWAMTGRPCARGHQDTVVEQGQEELMRDLLVRGRLAAVIGDGDVGEWIANREPAEFTWAGRPCEANTSVSWS